MNRRHAEDVRDCEPVRCPAGLWSLVVPYCRDAKDNKARVSHTSHALNTHFVEHQAFFLFLRKLVLFGVGAHRSLISVLTMTKLLLPATGPPSTPLQIALSPPRLPSSFPYPPPTPVHT